MLAKISTCCCLWKNLSLGRKTGKMNVYQFLTLLVLLVVNGKLSTQSSVISDDNVANLANKAILSEYLEPSKDSSDLEEKHVNYYDFLIYSYDGKSHVGPEPHEWSDENALPDVIVDGEVFAQNLCKDEWISPINIDTKRVVSPDESTILEEDRDFVTYQTLNFHVPKSSHIQWENWEVGHPKDSYQGLEIHTPGSDVFTLNDGFDHIGKSLRPMPDISLLTKFHLGFISLFYCDPLKASEERSTHQIDGKKFPLEIDFIFFSQPHKIGMDRFLCPDTDGRRCNAMALMVTILAEFSDEDNPRLTPLIDAVSSFSSLDSLQHPFQVPINLPWSPTWLIPLSSTYYYYESGTFLVPPCWPISRVYIPTETIGISENQLSVLTNISSTGNKMPCTYSVLQNHTENPRLQREIYYNEYDYLIHGDDGRKITEEEKSHQAVVHDKIRKISGTSFAFRRVRMPEKNFIMFSTLLLILF